MSDKIKLTLRLDRMLVPEGEAALRYLQALLVAPERPAHEVHERPRLNLALVIDRSGSMSGEKLERAKEAALYCLRTLTDRDRVALVSYDDEVRLVAPSQHLTPIARSRMAEQVQSLRVGGSTNLAGGWLTGAEQVAMHLHPECINRVILLSDGLANVGITDIEELARHATELRERGVSTTTMGIGEGFNEDLMEVLAIKGGGHFYFIERAHQIPDIVARELGEVMSTVARDLKLELRLPAAVRAILLNSYESRQLEPGVLVVSLGDLVAGEERPITFRLMLPEGTHTDPLFQVEIIWQDAITHERRRASDTVSARVASPNECAAEQPDPRVIEAVAVQEAATAREEALRFDREGNYAQSATVLHDAAERLTAMAPASPIVAAEADSLNQYSTAAPSGLGGLARKAMHYEKHSRQQGRRE